MSNKYEYFYNIPNGLWAPNVATSNGTLLHSIRIQTMGVYALMVVALLAAYLLWKWRNRHVLELSNKLPGPTILPGIGNAYCFIGRHVDFLQVIANLVRKYGEHMRFWIGPQFNVVVANPHDIRLMLTSNKMSQKGPLYDAMHEIIGFGILTGGATWRNHRKIVTPSYNKKAVLHFRETFNRESDALLRALETRDPGVAFNVYDDVVQITTQCVCQTLMGLSKQDSMTIRRLNEVIKVTPRFYALVFSKMTRWQYWPPFFQLFGHSRVQAKYKTAAHEMVKDIIARRMQDIRARGLTEADLEDEALGIVDRYILCGELSDKELLEETFSLFTTSQEASGKITASFLLFLAYLPDWQEKVYREILQVLDTPDRMATDEDFKKMPYLDMVYKEVLRYLPIAACIQRTTQDDILLEGAPVTIPAGTNVVIPIHALHRNPAYWEDPDEARPERFLPEEVKKRDPNAFVPFSLGPMDCLGRVYANTLIKTIVTRTIRRFRLVAPDARRLSELPLEVAISTEFRDGCVLKAVKRPGEGATC